MSGGNYLVYNFGLNPAVNFNFMLRVEGLFDLPCRMVRAFQKENEYEYIQEGGLNDYVHMRRKPISKPFTIQVERYVGVDMLDPLANGTELVLPLILYINRYSVYKEFHPIRMYVFTGCTVMSKEYGELNAEQSGLLLETTTIAYREMIAMDNIATSFVTDDTWEFDGTKKAGNGKRKANGRGTFGQSELSMEAVRKKAKKWIFKGGDSDKSKSDGSTEETQTSDTQTSDTQTSETAATDFLGIGTSSQSADQSRKDYEIRKDAIPKVKYGFKENGKENVWAKVTVGEMSLEESITKAKKWTFSRGNSQQQTEGGEQASQPAFMGNDSSSKSVQQSKNLEVRKEKMPNVKYSHKEDQKINKRAVLNETELSLREMERKAKKYDIAMNSNKSATGSDGAREKNAFEGKAKKYDIATNENKRAVSNYKERQESVKYSYKEDQKKNKRAVLNETELSLQEMEKKAKKYDITSNSNKSAIGSDKDKEKNAFEGKAKKYDIASNSNKSAIGSDKDKEKSSFERKAGRWPEVSRAVTVEKFMNTTRMGGKKK